MQQVTRPGIILARVLHKSMILKNDTMVFSYGQMEMSVFKDKCSE